MKDNASPTNQPATTIVVAAPGRVAVRTGSRASTDSTLTATTHAAASISAGTDHDLDEATVTTDGSTMTTTAGSRVTARTGRMSVLPQPQAGGRRTSKEVWDEVSQKFNQGNFYLTCKHCGLTKVSKQRQTTAMAEHLMSCNKCPNSTLLNIYKLTNSSKVKELGKKRNLHLLEKAGGNEFIAKAISDAEPKKKNFTPDIMEYVDKCSKERADVITLAIMEFVAGCGIAMFVIESSHFIKMQTSLLTCGLRS